MRGMHDYPVFVAVADMQEAVEAGQERTCKLGGLVG